MVTKTGIASWIAALAIIVFKGITGLMEKEMFWTHFTLSTILGDFSEKVIDSLPFARVRVMADILIYDIEIYILLIALGIICFIIGAFKKA